MHTASRLSAALAAAALLTACGGDDTGTGTAGSGETASDFPSETITLLVPYDAGGPTDLTSRTVGNCLQEQLGQTVVVENRPGGSGALAMQELIGAPADGYTLSLVTAGTMVLTPLANDLDYAADDITPIGVMAEVPSVLAAGKDSPYTDAEAFFQQAESAAGSINVGVPGASTPQGIELQRLADEYGVQVTAVPFDGNAEMTTALLGGNIDAVLINASKDVVENIEAGSFEPIAVSSEEPLSWLPETPTLAESGFPELTLAGSTFGLAGPAGLPEDVTETLEGALEDCMAEPEVQEGIGEQYVPEQFVGADGLAEVLSETQEVYESIL